MGSTSDLRRGAVLKYRGENCTVLEHVHVTPGKGPACHQVKMRNMKTGKLTEARFRPGESIDYVRVEHHDYEYLYQDGAVLYFMNQETYEQIPVNSDLVGEQIRFLKPNQVVKIAFEGDTPLAVELPPHVNLEIIETEPGFKGDTATNVMKPAKVETGTEVQVPLFINAGDVVRVSSEDGSYVERVAK